MKVIVIGASGETGRSIVKGLLESPTQFDITAVSRESSLNNEKNDRLRKLGVQVVAGNLKGPQEDLVRILQDADVVIAAVTGPALLDQIPLADAAKKAGVGRFIPCSFATASPPTGVMKLREIKEEVLNHIKKIYLPYTLIDVGWWYQLSPPRVPSGRFDYGLIMPVERIIGDGSVPSGTTHLDDVGRYVARIITDPRTLNKSVYAHSEVLTQSQIFDKVENISGEKLERSYLPVEELLGEISKVEGVAQAESADAQLVAWFWTLQYQYSWGVRGDNTPENAKYLGYLLGKDLYPDLEFTSFDGYLKELLEGRATKVYA